jgi:hypothetical protein
MSIFAELADNRLYGCTPVVGFIKPKKLRNREYKLCLNEGAILHLLDVLHTQNQLKIYAIFTLKAIFGGKVPSLPKRKTFATH